ncbi:hypothetical protein O1L60_12565 [Streptomyces diastatochromogenes]|nr:hypothetical protein [Streptomyces diastatochromogenes]
MSGTTITAHDDARGGNGGEDGEGADGTEGTEGATDGLPDALRRLSLGIALVVAAGAGALLSVGAFLGVYVRPTSDDWCALWKARDMGPLGITSDFYRTQNGRVTNAFLTGLLYSDGMRGPKLLPAFLIVTLGAGLFLLAREALRALRLPFPVVATVTAVLVLEALLFLAGTRSYQVLLWAPATLSHTLPSVLGVWAALSGCGRPAAAGPGPGPSPSARRSCSARRPAPSASPSSPCPGCSPRRSACSASPAAPHPRPLRLDVVRRLVPGPRHRLGGALRVARGPLAARPAAEASAVPGGGPGDVPRLGPRLGDDRRPVGVRRRPRRRGAPRPGGGAHGPPPLPGPASRAPARRAARCS